MPIFRIKDIRSMSPEEQQKRLAELQTELVRLKTLVKAGGALENPARIREIRKAVARLLTVKNEKKLTKEEGEG